MLTTHDSPAPPVIRSEFERRAQALCETRTQDPTNLPLGEEDGLHHHYAVGGFNTSAHEVPEAEREVPVLAETDRMENERVELVRRGPSPLFSDAHVFAEFARVPRPGDR
ncbi:hypothetical protein ABZ370_43455 [Streptomyces sp. NPDC005962]|uniref:hypothetical protein n=1 Tax=Streptomyces sp. NPDC005962 TaxID=3154466 RepID=UPI0033BFF553